MYGQGSNHAARRQHAPDQTALMSLNWNPSALARDDAEELRTRLAWIENRVQRFEQPITTREAFARFGTTLAVVPSAAIFIRLLWLVRDEPAIYWLLPLAVLMSLACFGAGRSISASLAAPLERAEASCWVFRLILPALIGMLWGIATGGAGGFLFFGIGSLFGALAAAVVGALGFTLFSSLHRMLSRGGMIEARHLRQLVYGVNALIVGMIFLIQ